MLAARPSTAAAKTSLTAVLGVNATPSTMPVAKCADIPSLDLEVQALTTGGTPRRAPMIGMTP